MKELLRIFTCDIDPDQKIRLLYASASLLKYDYANNRASEDIDKVVEEMVKALQSKPLINKSNATSNKGFAPGMKDLKHHLPSGVYQDGWPVLDWA